MTTPNMQHSATAPKAQAKVLPKVLASRPKDQNGLWCQRLKEHGFEPVNIPLLAINPVTEPTKQRALKTCMLHVDTHSTLIFVSQNAVKYFFEQLDLYWPQLIEGWRLIGVGSATKQALIDACQDFGGANNLQILGGENAMNSEALLAMPELQNVADEKILICRGVGGRTRIGETLTLRKANIAYCELYQRDLPVNAIQQLTQTAFDPKHDSLVFFSGETLTNFTQAFMQANTNNTIDPQIRVIVPSERVAEMAKKAGFLAVYVAKNATTNAMISTLMTSYA